MTRPVPLLILIAVSGVLLSGCAPHPNPNSLSSDLEAIAVDFEKDRAAAIPLLKEHVAKNPRDDMAWTMLGHAYTSTNQVSDAESAYKTALEINPQRFQAVNAMGILRRKAGDYDGAMAYYQRAIQLDPKYASAYASMAVIEVARYQDQLALEHAEKAYKLDSEDPVVAANLAVVYHYNGMIKDRDRMTEKARSLGYKQLAGLQRIYSGEDTIRAEDKN